MLRVFCWRSLLWWMVSVAAPMSGATAMPVSGAPQTIAGLGTTSFVTSTKSPEAQAAFMRGLLLLHLFEYGQAADAFVQAEKLDGGFAMAYWGEAMTFNHGVWNQVSVKDGKAALEKFGATASARAARVSDARERAYLAAVEVLYDGAGTKAERDLRYVKAMEEVNARYPKDLNAKLFYALALLGQSESVRDVPVYLRAAEMAKGVFREEPQNPGAAHYWIHGMDDPDHAARALEAARALSKIAPDAPHAQHMCSHIFMALGMWDDVVAANVEAVAVDDARDKADGFPPLRCGHYPLWLEYGYFQQGKFHAAEQTVEQCRQSDVEDKAWEAGHPGKVAYGAKDAGRLHARLAAQLAEMQVMAAIERADWRSAAACDVAAGLADVDASCEFASGLAAAERGDLDRARAGREGLRRQLAAYRAEKDAIAELVGFLSVDEEELHGLIEVKAGHEEAGLAALRRAVESYRGMAFAFGPPGTVKPPEELLGEVLLAKGDAAGARRAFEQALERAPKRTLSLLGLARAERLGGDEAAARKSYAELAGIWHDADGDAPGMAEVREAVAGVRAGAGRE